MSEMNIKPLTKDDLTCPGKPFEGFQFVGQFYMTMVRDFNRMGGKPHGERDPGNVPPNERELLYNLIREELEEFKAAMEAGDLTQILDALGDLQYVLCVAVIFHGLDKVFPTAFMEIHRANMMKFPPADQRDEFEVAIKSRYPDTPFLIHEKEGHLVALRKRDGKILKPGACTPRPKAIRP